MPAKWIAVRVSAGLAIAGSVVTLAFGLLMPVSMALAPPPAGPGAPPFPMMVVGILMALIFAAFAAWGIVTGIAIFRRRGWARISIMAFAVLLAIMGVRRRHRRFLHADAAAGGTRPANHDRRSPGAGRILCAAGGHRRVVAAALQFANHEAVFRRLRRACGTRARGRSAFRSSGGICWPRRS